VQEGAPKQATDKEPPKVLSLARLHPSQEVEKF